MAAEWSYPKDTFLIIFSLKFTFWGLYIFASVISPSPNLPSWLLPQVYKWSFVPSLVITAELFSPKDTCLIVPLSLRAVTSPGVVLSPSIPNWPSLLLPQVYKWSLVPSLVITAEWYFPKDTCLIVPLSLRAVTSWGVFW